MIYKGGNLYPLTLCQMNLGLSPAEMTIQSGCRISKHCCKEIRLGDCSLDSNFQRNAI